MRLLFLSGLLFTAYALDLNFNGKPMLVLNQGETACSDTVQSPISGAYAFLSRPSFLPGDSIKITTASDVEAVANLNFQHLDCEDLVLNRNHC